MIAAINDLPFHYQMSSLDEAVSRFSAFIKICKSIEDGHMTNVEKIVIAPESDYSGHLAPGLVLQQIIPKIKSKEDQRYIMSLLKNRDAAPIDADTAPFCFDGKEFWCLPVFYPVGNGRFNAPKAIEDLIWIKNQK